MPNKMQRSCLYTLIRLSNLTIATNLTALSSWNVLQHQRRIDRMHFTAAMPLFAIKTFVQTMIMMIMMVNAPHFATASFQLYLVDGTRSSRCLHEMLDSIGSWPLVTALLIEIGATRHARPNRNKTMSVRQDDGFCFCRTLVSRTVTKCNTTTNTIIVYILSHFVVYSNLEILNQKWIVYGQTKMIHYSFRSGHSPSPRKT